jgi:hypothetical protein
MDDGILIDTLSHTFGSPGTPQDGIEQHDQLSPFVCNSHGFWSCSCLSLLIDMARGCDKVHKSSARRMPARMRRPS